MLPTMHEHVFSLGSDGYAGFGLGDERGVVLGVVVRALVGGASADRSRANDASDESHENRGARVASAASPPGSDAYGSAVAAPGWLDDILRDLRSMGWHRDHSKPSGGG